MSKKSRIVELLQKDVDVDDICTELEVSASYVYRIKREMDEFEGNKNEDGETEGDNSDDLVINPSGGSGDNVEGDNEDLEEKKGKRSANTNTGVGGVKKRKKSSKKVNKSIKIDSSEQNSTEQNSTEHNGIIKWIKMIQKKMLLVLISLILLAMMMLHLSRRKEPEMEAEITTLQSRFPTIT